VIGRRALAIVNPASGRQPGEAIVAILTRSAASLGVELTIVLTSRAGDAVSLARGAIGAFDIVIAAGGDGTVSEVVTGTIGSTIIVGVVPIGSTNMIAKELGIPRDPRRAAAIALGTGEPRPVDVARVGSTICLHMAGTGLDAIIMRDTSLKWKRRVGWLAYIPVAVRNLNLAPFQLTMTIDGRVVSTPARLVLFAIGSSIIHPWFRVGDGIDRTDGVADICVFSPTGIAATLSTLGWFGLGRAGRSRWLRQYRCQCATIEADRTMPYEVDGDVRGELPVTIEMLEHPVRILVPHGPAD
jgi:YegS/Rv2252/BmrU family lipid kinase